MRKKPFLLLLGSLLWASHNLAGQITYECIGPNQYRVTITTYTDSAAAGVDRCTADLEIWSVVGNSKSLTQVIRDIPRANGPSGSGCSAPARLGIRLRPRVKKNFYTTIVTLPGPGVFELRYTDFARVDNVRNMTNSGATSFYVETQLTNNPFLGCNDSPRLLNDPIDDACTNRLWTHNPGAYDPDGDSLVFSLVPSQQYDPGLMQNPTPVGNYQFPNAFGGRFFIDRTTGLVTWDTPQQVGVYNVAILIEEFRRGRKIGHVIRDMAIFVAPCINQPPIIIAPAETCITAEQLLTFLATARDPDARDSVYFYLNNGGQGFNGPFQVPSSPATVNPSSFPLIGVLPPQVSTFFSWQTNCSHIRPSFYQIDWYAHDNLTNRPPLAANHITKIYVNSPPPTGLTLTPGPRQLTLTWQAPACQPDSYRVYRAPAPQAYTDTPCCRTPLLGYTSIATLPGSVTTFTDRDLEFSPRYCYRVRAVYRGVESCPSEEACINLPINFPLMTQDSVHTTAPSAGAIWVSWNRPLTLDSVFFPPPYTFSLERAAGLTGTAFQTIATGLTGETYLDASPPLSTSTTPYRYRVRLIDSQNREIASSNTATSLFLKLFPRDQAILLEWTQNAPWVNDTFFIYRADPPQPNTFQLIATVPARSTGIATLSYLDQGLRNDTTYCYYVLSHGSYGVAGLRDPLLNASNKACAAPRDTIPPCSPDPASYQIRDDCEANRIELTWAEPDSSCGGDVGSYGIYISIQPEGPYTPLTYVREPVRSYTWQGTGTHKVCLALTAIDTSGNESTLGPPTCFDNCPFVMLPNTFTPNGDGINDVFRPFIYRHIRSVECQIYDRWGLLIHESRDIDRLWDGTYRGQPAPEGTYFFLFRAVLDTREERPFQKAGAITLLR